MVLKHWSTLNVPSIDNIEKSFGRLYSLLYVITDLMYFSIYKVVGETEVNDVKKMFVQELLAVCNKLHQCDADLKVWANNKGTCCKLHCMMSNLSCQQETTVTCSYYNKKQQYKANFVV